MNTVTMQYYEKAIEKIKKLVADPVFFVFSDDLAFCRHVLGDGYVFVDINDCSSSYADLELMRMCRHHIIANSTFSWWGAWLASHPQQYVIAPLMWSNHEKCPVDLPERWVRI